jgi:hypothetical protein
MAGYSAAFDFYYKQTIRPAYNKVYFSKPLVLMAREVE